MTVSAGIFRQYDIRGIVGEDLTTEAAYAIGGAYATWIRRHGSSGAVVVGRDNRPSGAMLRDALVRGLNEQGLFVVDIGVVPTPVMYWSLHHLQVVGGIQITGSHNPSEYNGFKLCFGTRTMHGAQLQELYDIQRHGMTPALKATTREQHGIIARYIDDIVARVGRIRRPTTVVVDCGNGAGALVAEQLFDRLGVKVVPLFCESDGTFPNHHPDPTVEKNLVDLIVAVRQHHADIGIAFDGDADRLGVIADDGRIIWGDHVLILYARDVLERTGRDQAIIFDVKCSQALPDEITKAGGRPVMWKTGHSLIKDKMRELNAPIAGEMSGHMFFAEGFYGHDDAMYGAARLLSIIDRSGKSISELLSDVPAFVSTPELRVDVPESEKFAIVDRAVKHFSATHEVIGVDGARVLFGDGWGLIRASNTQPILVTRFEARTPERLKEIRDEMEGWIRSQGIAV
ncbi:MAG: phosphomannomutase/phosphoglucomutase [Gemmatimonadaceae bacterium]